MTHLDTTFKKNRLLAFPLVAVLTSCQEVDLSDSCLPLKAPTTVHLAIDVVAQMGIHTNLRLDPPAPTQIDPVIPAGTSLQIAKISQQVQFDTSSTEIEVFGELNDGRTFIYSWGRGQTIFRAPWEPATTPEIRRAECAHI
jgi:hypothetical protein